VWEAVRFYLLEACKRAPPELQLHGHKGRLPSPNASPASTTPPARACVVRTLHRPATVPLPIGRRPFKPRADSTPSDSPPVPTNARARDESQDQAAWGFAGLTKIGGLRGGGWQPVTSRAQEARPRGFELRGPRAGGSSVWTWHGIATRASVQQASAPGSQQLQAPSLHVHSTFPLHCKHNCRKLTRNFGDVSPTLKGSIVSR